MKRMLSVFMVLACLAGFFVIQARVSATDLDPLTLPNSAHTKYHCGGAGDTQVTTSIDLGCKEKGNGILDLMFALIRFLSMGVGLVVVGSMVVAGIQFTTSRGDPQATAKAIGRMTSTVLALLIFIFAYAIVNYLVPGAVLK